MNHAPRTKSFVSRFFYPLLMLATASLAIALWRQQESSCHLLGPEVDPNSETSNAPFDDPNAGQAGTGTDPIDRAWGSIRLYADQRADCAPPTAADLRIGRADRRRRFLSASRTIHNGVSISSLPPSREMPAATAGYGFDPAVMPVQYQGPIPGGPQYPQHKCCACDRPRIQSKPRSCAAELPHVPACPVRRPATGVNRPVATGQPPAGYPNTVNYSNAQQSPGAPDATDFVSFPSPATSSLPTDFVAPWISTAHRS